MQDTPSPLPEKSTTGRSNGDPAIRVTPTLAMLGVVMRGVHRVSPSLGARVAARVFLSPRRAAVPERERAWLKQARPETFRLPRFELSGHRWASSGPLVLLVHGWEGRGSQLGGFAVALAALGYQPVSIDLPAHGASRGAQTNLMEFAESVGSLVKSFGKVEGIVAHSFGAAATTVALREGLDVGRLVYIAPSEDFDHFPRMFGQTLGLPRQLSEEMKHTIERRIGATMAELRGGGIAPRMRAPLLIVHDEDDADVPLADGQTYAGAWPGASLVTTHGLGHRRILRDPSVLDTAARFFGPAIPGGGK